MQVLKDDYIARVRRDGQEALKLDPWAQHANCNTHAWRTMSEAEAVVFGLDRQDRSSQQHALKLLPRKLARCILDAGVIHLLPAHEISGNQQAAQVYRALLRAGVRRVVDCYCQACEATVEMPDKLGDECIECSGELRYQLVCSWFEQNLEQTVGQWLGESSCESYGVWLDMCRASVIGM